MSDFNIQSNYSGPTTTVNSKEEGRLKVDVGKKNILKKKLKKYYGKYNR